MTEPIVQRGRRPGAGWRWAAYGACVAAGANAAVSLYWALGGTAGLDTVGGVAERMARSGGTVALLAISITVLLKALGALLALALARPGDDICPGAPCSSRAPALPRCSSSTVRPR